MDRFSEVKERVKEAHDLVTVVESYIPLRQAGRYMTALCPFHQEKTPSFTVYADSQHFKCYGCGLSGDVFTFVQEKEGWDFRTAFEVLAERAGISLEGVFGRGGRRRGPERMSAHDALAKVARFLHGQLLAPEGRAAREYLEARGLDGGIQTFGLGYHPTKRGALRRFAAEEKLPMDALEQAGLVGSNGRESFYGRLMFPIQDERGRVVGFGGRALGDAKPKYINSPESPFFRKRQVLYGLRQAKDAGDRRIVVMEGYTDVIACHLAGFRGAVATLGTALTRDHGKALVRYARDGLVLLFDGDRAGRAAAEKGYGELMRSEVPARVALLPEGTDPADLLAGGGGEDPGAGFEALLGSAEDATAMWFRLKRMRLNLTDAAQMKVVVDECAHVLDGIEDDAQRAVLQSRMAQHLGLEEAVLRRSLVRRAKRRPAERDGEPTRPIPRGSGASPLVRSDTELLACVVAEPGLLGMAVDGCPDDGQLGSLLDAALRTAEARGGAVTGDQLLNAMFTVAAGAPELTELLGNAADMAVKLREPGEKLTVLLQHRNAYRAKVAAQQIKLELQEAKAAGDRQRVDELTERYLDELRHQQFG